MAQNNGTIPKTVTNGSNIQLNQTTTQNRFVHWRQGPEFHLERQGLVDGTSSRGSDMNLNNRSVNGIFLPEEDGIQGSRQDNNSRNSHGFIPSPVSNERSVEALQFQLINANSRLEEMTARCMFLERMSNEQGKARLSEIGRLSSKMNAIDSQIVSLRSALRETNRLFERMDSDFGELLLDVREYVQHRPPTNYNPFTPGHNFSTYIPEGGFHFESRQPNHSQTDPGWSMNSRVPDSAEDLAHSFSSTRFGVQTPGALNNKILPGERTNNYWDNFRSNSRQNCLSTSNTDHFVAQVQSQPGLSSLPFVLNRGMTEPVGFSTRTSSDRSLLSQTMRRKLKINIEQNRDDSLETSNNSDQSVNLRETNMQQVQFQTVPIQGANYQQPENHQNHFKGLGTKAEKGKEPINTQRSSLIKTEEVLDESTTGLAFQNDEASNSRLKEDLNLVGTESSLVSSSKDGNNSVIEASSSSDVAQTASTIERVSGTGASSEGRPLPDQDASIGQVFVDDFEDDLLWSDGD